MNRFTAPVILPLLLLLPLHASAAVVPDNPSDAGGTQSLSNCGGAAIDGAMGNPALVGLERPPRGGLSLFPVSVALWSDKFAPPFNKRLLMLPFNMPRSTANYIAAFMRESFEIGDGLSPEEVSERLTEGLRGGVGVHAGMRASPLVFATRGFGISVGVFSEVDARLPSGFLLPLFLEAEGLLAAGDLDLSDARLNMVSATEIAVKLGYSVSVPFLRDYLKLDKGAAGVGLKALLGHAYLGAEMREGGVLSYDEGENKYKADAVFDVVSVGAGPRGGFRYDMDYLFSHPINGQGWGFDIGAVFHNNSHAFSVDVRDIGMILWSGAEVRRGALAMKKELGPNDLKQGIAGMFGFDTLEPSGENYAMWLPAALNAGYAYSRRVDGALNTLLGFISAGAGYNLPLTPGYGGASATPRRFSGGVTLGLLAGYLPVRYGAVYGGQEGLASVAGVGLDAQYFSIDAYYKAIGSLAMRSKKGFEAAAGVTFRWGRKPNRGYVKDAPDKDAPEEPAWIVDSVAEPVLPELDEFPPDSAGETVYEPIETNAAITPPQPEIQPPQPEPPQPEPEQPQPAEPEPPQPESEAPRPTAEEADALSVAQRAINFTPGSADLTKNSYAPLEEVAELLKRYPGIRYEVRGHTDSWGAESHNLLLSAERAAVVKYYLMSKGAPDSCLVSIGYGRNMPIADNNTVVGRALNRRVEFVRIDSREQYDTLKRFEMDMMKRLTERVLEKREWLRMIK